MSEQEKAGDDVDRGAPSRDGSYEPPEIEDLSAPNGPTVTAAGGPSIPKAAPREL